MNNWFQKVCALLCVLGVVAIAKDTTIVFQNGLNKYNGCVDVSLDQGIDSAKDTSLHTSTLLSLKGG